MLKLCLLLLKKEELNIEHKEKIALKSENCYMVFEKDNIPFFSELNKTNRVVCKDNEKYYLYQAPTLELEKRVKELIGNDNIGIKIDKYSVDDKDDINIIKDNLVQELNKFNNTYQGFYCFHLLEQDNNLYVVDEYEEFYYGSQDFDNCLEEMESKFKKIVNDKDLYLDCDCPARWVIVSDKIHSLINEYDKDIKI